MLLSFLYERTNPGTYAGIRFTDDTVKQLVDLQHELSVPNPVDRKDFHTTLLYSRKHLPKYEAAGKLNPAPVADACECELVIWPSGSGKKKILVLKYKCSWLEERHKQLSNEHNATWDYDDYIPHITLSYDIGNWQPSDMAVTFKEPITLKWEYQEELDPDR